MDFSSFQKMSTFLPRFYLFGVSIKLSICYTLAVVIPILSLVGFKVELYEQNKVDARLYDVVVDKKGRIATLIDEKVGTIDEEHHKLSNLH